MLVESEPQQPHNGAQREGAEKHFTSTMNPRVPAVNGGPTTAARQAPFPDGPALRSLRCKGLGRVDAL